MLSKNITAELISQSNNWKINTQGEFIKSFEALLQDDNYVDDDIHEIVNNAVNTLVNCPNPKSDQNVKKTGIVIGKVQSGKTSNFLALTALAFDNGYNIVTIFGGTKNNLVQQNFDRIEENFDGDKVVILNVKENPNMLTVESLTRLIRKGMKIIIVSIKQAVSINLISSLFDRTDLDEETVLIIDDEGDEFTLDTNFRNSIPSSTNKAITDLKQVIPNHAFISVTATPQANLIIARTDVISPDFGVFVEPGYGYCGLETYHSDDSPYTIEIPEEEESLISSQGIPKSAKEAIAIFLVGCAITRIKYGHNEKLSMLIHPTHIVNDLKEVKDKIDVYLQEWASLVKNPRDIAFGQAIDILKEAHEELDKTLVTKVPFEEILSVIGDVVEDCIPHLITGENSLVPKDHQYYSYNIFIGGNMLGRGLTIKNLAVSFIIRGAKGKSNVDTLQQRARWFGYREKQLELSRIFATNKILGELNEVRDHESDLWSVISLGVDNGLDFKRIERIFKLPDRLRMTRTSVGQTTTYKIHNWITDQTFHTDDLISDHNKSVVRNFKDKHKARLVKDYIVEDRPNEVVNDLLFSEVLDELLLKMTFDVSSSLNPKYLAIIMSRLEKKDIDVLCDVVWMRGEEKSMTNVIDGRVKNYQQGRRNNYVGDKNYPTKPQMQIQIHNLTDKETGRSNPTIAIYLPEEYTKHLINLVISED